MPSVRNTRSPARNTRSPARNAPLRLTNIPVNVVNAHIARRLAPRARSSLGLAVPQWAHVRQPVLARRQERIDEARRMMHAAIVIRKRLRNMSFDDAERVRRFKRFVQTTAARFNITSPATVTNHDTPHTKLSSTFYTMTVWKDNGPLLLDDRTRRSTVIRAVPRRGSWDLFNVGVRMGATQVPMPAEVMEAARRGIATAARVPLSKVRLA